MKLTLTILTGWVVPEHYRYLPEIRKEFQEAGWKIKEIESTPSNRVTPITQFWLSRELESTTDITQWWDKEYLHKPVYGEPEIIAIKLHAVIKGFSGSGSTLTDYANDALFYHFWSDSKKVSVIQVRDGRQLGEDNLRKFQSLVEDTCKKIELSKTWPKDKLPIVPLGFENTVRFWKPPPV